MPILRGLLCLAVLGLSACVSIPAPLQGDVAPLLPNQVSTSDLGQTVRWGGMVINTTPRANETCIEVLAQPLNVELRPTRGDQALGRFVACRPGFLDPAVVSAGREVTVLGRLTRFEDGQIGEQAYRYPVIDSEVVYLWPVRPEVIEFQRRHGPFYDPWHYPVPRGRVSVSGAVIIRR